LINARGRPEAAARDACGHLPPRRQRPQSFAASRYTFRLISALAQGQFCAPIDAYLSPNLTSRAKYPADVEVDTLEDGVARVALCEQPFENNDQRVWRDYTRLKARCVRFRAERCSTEI
jgi:hypothetical protein